LCGVANPTIKLSMLRSAASNSSRPSSSASTGPRVEHHRKQAKRLLRGYHQDEPDAVTRVRKVLGQPASMSLADAQQVIAIEHGQRSWADFKQAIEDHRGALAEAQPVASRVRVGPCEEKIVERIAGASLALYQELLDLDTADDRVG
jgi:hypothetical protein